MNLSSGEHISAEAIRYLVHHVVLPPKLPQTDDHDIENERCLTKTTISALEDLKAVVKGEHVKVVASAISAITKILRSRDGHGHVAEAQLEHLFDELLEAAPNEFFAIEVQAQNAGILVSRHDDDIIFEFFELCPTNAAVVQTKGRLVRTFPGTASKIPITSLRQEGLKRALAQTIAKMITQAAPGCQPQVLKQNKMHDEMRDTADPAMVTDYLMNLIAAVGGTTDTIRITKNTRDETLWDDCLEPWRRSPLWLLLRVSLHLFFTRSGSHMKSSDSLYKAFMVLLLAKILRSAKSNQRLLNTETLYIVSAKLVRRLRKFESLDQAGCLQPGWIDPVRATIDDAHDLMNREWKVVVNNTERNVNEVAFQKMRPENHLSMTLPDLDTFLARIKSRRQSVTRSDFKPTSVFPLFAADRLPESMHPCDENVIYFLAAVENWVEINLQSWVASNLTDSGTCGKLRRLIEKYHSIASAKYIGIPISMSIMYLTTLELWVACDTSACCKYPILLPDYDPELDLKELQCLLLPLRSQMERLHKVERYVKSRQDRSCISNPSIYRHFGHQLSFAVQFFDTSDELQKLLSDIEHNAAEERRKKIVELAGLKRKYEDLMNRYDGSECEYKEKLNRTYGFTEFKHKSNCARCALKHQADGLSIRIHEWPVSSNKSIAKATVFELRAPETFSEWRDATLFLILDVLESCDEQAQKPKTSYTLDRHEGISHLLSSHYQQQRIIPLSSVKSHTSTHRKRKKAIPNLEQDDVCLQNALRYEYCDKSRGTWNGYPHLREEVTQKCMYQLPDRSQSLQRYLCKPPSAIDGVIPNEVVASLSDCPAHVSIEEYKSFGILPFGQNIIYLNILQQLASPTLDFSKVETHCLMSQIIHQTGPPNGSIERTTHEILTGAKFCHVMIDQLEANLQRLSENWESWRALGTFSQLTRRILSFTSSIEIRQRSCEYLAEVRGVCIGWICRLKNSAASSTDDNHRTELNSRIAEIALLGTTTFDVDGKFFDDILQHQSAISTLLQCSISVQENEDSATPECQKEFKVMLQAWKSLMYRLFHKLRDRILDDSTGVNQAVTVSWASFQPGSEAHWSSLPRPQEHWLHTMSGTLPVHLNLLTAELLVNGLPLANVPPNFMRHQIWRPLFQQSKLEVVPTDQPGMKFTARSLYHQYKLHFGMEENDMLIVAIRDGSRFDLIPSRLVESHLPHAFVKDFIHWYDHCSGEIIFRPRENPWPFEGTVIWHLQHVDSFWRLVRGAKILVDITSECAKTIFKVFGPLEDDKHVHTFFNTTSRATEIELPRVRLGFYVTQGQPQIHSRQYRGKIVDPDQTVGILVGLEDKLILRDAHLTDERLILVPEGWAHCDYTSSNQHVSVSIIKDTVVKVHAYTVDSVLGRLTDSGDLQSKLWRCYMHALTSSCLPDPLTNHTGTESALTIINSAAVHSFQSLNSENIELLNYIATLSPCRSFYPSDKRVMQQINWNCNLPSLSQHWKFYTSVRDIFFHWTRMKLFHPDGTYTEPTGLPHMELELLERDAIRSSTYRVAGFGVEKFTTGEDITYDVRDRPKNSERGRRAFVAATMIAQNQAALHTPVIDLQKTLLDTHFQGSTVKGSSSFVELSLLRYDSKWLGTQSDLLIKFWCNFYESLTTSSRVFNKFSIMAWLSTMAYAKSADMSVVQALAVFYRMPDMFWHQIPSASVFELSRGTSWQLEQIRSIAQSNIKCFTLTLRARNPKYRYETHAEHNQRLELIHQNGQDDAIRNFITGLEIQWPCEQPHLPAWSDIGEYIDTSAAMRNVKNTFQAWYNNRLFVEYLQGVSAVLKRQAVASIPSTYYSISAPIKRCVLSEELRSVDIGKILALELKGDEQETSEHHPFSRCSYVLKSENTDVGPPKRFKNTAIESGLNELCQRLETYANSRYEKEYIKTLRRSCEAQARIGEIQRTHDYGNTRDALQEHLDSCTDYFEKFGIELTRAIMEGGTEVEKIALNVQQFLRISPTVWLSFLNQERFDSMSETWKSSIIGYALAITNLHRAERLVALSSSLVDLSEELSHVGHTNWNPLDFPENLLLEAESGIMIREVQEAIAKQMRCPPDHENTMYQLNMGEGKSSTIVPSVANFLADKQTLVRVIVARPQSKQMLQMLVVKLGGLLNRRIYHMPFSRNIRPSRADADTIRTMCEECMTNRGILLVQPEHILSFKLMGIECLLTGRHDTAHSLLDTQHFFDTVSRDIVDESDENFSVKFELVYTMGCQRLIELAPERWIIIQEVLGLISRYAPQVKDRFPLSIEVQHQGNGNFPRVRVLRKDAADALLEILAKHLVENGLSGLPIRNQSPTIQAAVFQYITQTDIGAEDIQSVESSNFWTESTKLPLLLVRGLMAGGILRFTLMEKRWRVNFGLDDSRTPRTKLAVPYRSKDCPSPRSEFSHPDVIIVFTLLSYYYGGLSNEELFDNFTHILRSDQAIVHYDEWVSFAPNLAPPFRQLSGVSIKDRVLCIEKIFPHLRYSKAAIDYYLSRFVFPKEMKEFPHKISASGWDIGAIKPHPTTGFSGTKDTLHLLPLNVKHLDLPSQIHTNALVLGYLLRKETSVAPLLPHTNGTDAEHLLATVCGMNPEVRVILDVGALILEMDNFTVASRWLSMCSNDQTQAIVFFQDEELSVLDHTGTIESFQISPFSKQLDVCLVYLDEAHTRGTDLKLPRNYRAAVTLGTNLTKDRLVQACMRMRKLGKGQSVTFVIPQEISTKINDQDNRPLDTPIGVSDVLCWSIEETWLDIAKSMPLWAVQGRRFEQHKTLLDGANTTEERAKMFLEEEAQDIEARYKPHTWEHRSQFQQQDVFDDNIERINSRCRDFQVKGLGSASLQEEQERELAPEVEEEKQIERPARMDAAPHQIHPDLKKLVRTGNLLVGSKAFEPAFQALRSSSAAQSFDPIQLPSDLLVTADFIRTVEIPLGTPKESFISDSYQRPVQWILSVLPKSPKSTPRLVVLSPYEVNHLFSSIQNSTAVTLHIFSPRFNASFASLDRLDLYNLGRDFSPRSVSDSLTVQLNLFAGSLYLRSLEEYGALCDFLGLLKTKAEAGQQVFADGFINPPSGKWGLKNSPIPFLSALLMKIRKEGEGLEKTHLGKILNGLRLEESDFKLIA